MENQTIATADPAADTARKMMTYDANKKSLAVAYLMWFFFGGLGVHRFYLGATGSAVLMLMMTLIGTVLVLVYGLGLLLLIPVAIWLLVDAFIIPGIVQRSNSQLIDRMH